MCRPKHPQSGQIASKVQGPSWSGWLLFQIYKKFISPVLHAFTPSSCLYLPTCSEYAYVALTRFGPVRGGWMAFWRVLRCNPLSSGGLDPVPEAAAHHDRLP